MVDDQHTDVFKIQSESPRPKGVDILPIVCESDGGSDPTISLIFSISHTFGVSVLFLQGRRTYLRKVTKQVSVRRV